MDSATLGLLAFIGLASGFLAGLLGIGGGVVVIPALVYGAGIPVKLATGISVVEAFFATLSGAVAHRRNRTADVRLGVMMGASGLFGAFLGAYSSAYLSGRTVLTVYLSLVVVALLLLFIARREEKSKTVSVNRWSAVASGLGIGFVAGMLGVGGGFLLIPTMISLLRVPTRVAVGTSLLVVILTTFSGAAGKIATGQFDLQMGIPVVIAGVIGAQLGGRVNGMVSPRAIRICLTLLLVGIVLRTGMDLLSGSATLH